jgi:hypothetical protein
MPVPPVRIRFRSWVGQAICLSFDGFYISNITGMMSGRRAVSFTM